MELLCYCLALVSLSVLHSLQPASGQGVSLEHNDSTVSNFGLLGHSEIDITATADVCLNLVCQTDNTACCRNGDNPNGLGFGDWYYPSGDVVAFNSGPKPSGEIYRMMRHIQVIRLRRDGAATITSAADGIYRCEVADQNGTMQTRYAGLYTDGAGVISISQDSQFSLTSTDTLEFTLTVTTTGGPPTTSQWTLPNDTMLFPNGDSFSQRVVDAVASTVVHTLTVTDGLTGEYVFTTVNSRTSPTLSMNFTIQAANPPSRLMAVQSGSTSVNVSWTAPAQGGAMRTGYRILYHETGGNEQCVDVGADITSQTLTVLQSGATYSISIVALSDTLPSTSTVVGPEMVILQVLEAPVVTTEVLSSTSIRVAFTRPSGNLPAESYNIQYTRVVGAGQVLCPNRNNPNDTMKFTGVASPYDIISLQEFSTYDITVTAVFSDAMIPKTVQKNTFASAPTAAPRNLTNTTVLSTSITVGWRQLQCIERNGVIVNYIVRFGPEVGAQNESTVQSDGIDKPGTYTASELTPSTRYFFEVAAVNSAGTGPFTARRIVMTNAVSPPTGLTAVQSGLTSVLVSWTAPASDSAVITGYNITYSTGGGREQSVGVEADATSYTLTDLQSEATYNISIISLINTTSSNVEGPMTIIVEEFLLPTVMIEVLNSTSIIVTSIQPNASLVADRYDIQYTRVTEVGQAVCPKVTGSGTATNAQSPYTVTNLEEFSTYNVTVTAHAFTAFAFSEMLMTTEQVMMSPEAPSSPPQSVMVSSVNSSSITVQWGRVSCIDRNSVVTGYTVRYGQTGSTTANMTVSGTGTSDRMITASGLLPRTNYTFEVAAVSSAGTGPFSTGTTVETAVFEGVALKLNGQCYGNNSLVTLTDIGEGDSAALFCLTDREQCCRGGDNNNGGPLGEWYFPNNGSALLFGFNDVSIFQNRGASRVRLNRRNNAQSPTGLYRCEVPDASGMDQSIYVGVYLENSGNLTNAFLMYNEANNSLICLSTGGPATTVVWKINNTEINARTAGFNAYQIITNTTEAAYDNVLQLSGGPDEIIGNYSCNVSNGRSTPVHAVYAIHGIQIFGETALQSGLSYSINCTSDLEVDTIRWLDGAGNTVEQGENSFLILQLNDVTSALSGARYTCQTNSLYGVQERSITLSVAASSSAVAVGAVVGVIVAIVAVLVVITVILCIACRMKCHWKFTLFDKVYSKPKTRQSYGIPYNISGSGFGDTGTIELKEVKEEVDRKDDDYFENPAAIVKDRTRPIPLSQFGAHVRRMHHDRDKKFELEFDSLIKHPQSSVDIAQIPYNRERNRFGNIFPYNQNRVLLSEIPGVDGSDYINASYIEGYNETENAYIAAQGPMPNSVGDFWRMIWENKLPTVVMLTRCFEGKPKCERYWPETLESKLNLKNNLVVSMTEVLPFTEYEIRKLEVHDTSKPSERPLKVTQLHYTIWPDHGVPTNAMSVINFIKRVRRTHPVGRASARPLVVHCSAGVGRTGTFIVLDVMLQRIKEVDNVNVYKFITELRTQRVFMVQSQSQYVFIHDAIDELITCGETEIAATDIRLTINKLTAFGDGGKTGFQKQFQNLQQVSPKPKDIDLKSARNPQNVSKNRYQENIVNDLTRVRISPSGRACTDYINAAFVDGYRKRGAYISTQGPMKETVNDFWKMIKEFQSKCIVMLCKLNENGEESCYCYWPTGNGASEVYGKLKVTLISQETCTDYVVRRLEVTDEKQRSSGLAADGGSFIVTQFHLSRWAPHSTPSTFALLEVVTKMTKVQMTSGNKAITVMCNDGVGRTGTFIAIHTQLERLKTEGLVDVFQCIKSARLQRAGLVHSLEQYIFCHNVLEDFLDSFDTYANFKELV